MNKDAINYNSDATSDDQSCVGNFKYSNVNYKSTMFQCPITVNLNKDLKVKIELSFVNVLLYKTSFFINKRSQFLFIHLK